MCVPRMWSASARQGASQLTPARQHRDPFWRRRRDSNAAAKQRSTSNIRRSYFDDRTFVIAVCARARASVCVCVPLAEKGTHEKSPKLKAFLNKHIKTNKCSFSVGLREIRRSQALRGGMRKWPSSLEQREKEREREVYRPPCGAKRL